MWLAVDYDNKAHLFENKPYIKPGFNTAYAEKQITWSIDSGWKILININDPDNPFSDMTCDMEPVEISYDDLYDIAHPAKSLSYKWNQVCDEYLEKFMEKHEYNDDISNVWINGDIGEIANIGDMYIDMSVIRYDIDNNITESKFGEWYWKHLDRYEMGLPYMNYESFCKGCPDPISPEKEKEIMECRKRIIDAEKALETEKLKYKEVAGVNYKGF